MLEGFFFVIYLIHPLCEIYRQIGSEIRSCENETSTKGEDIDGTLGSIRLTMEL